jgi:hypothetical protein
VSPVRYKKVFISQKAAFFMVTAVKTSNLASAPDHVEQGILPTALTSRS